MKSNLARVLAGVVMVVSISGCSIPPGAAARSLDPLADGAISFEEYQEAHQRWLACMVAQGALAPEYSLEDFKDDWDRYFDTGDALEFEPESDDFQNCWP